MDETEIIINLRNGQRGEVPLSENAFVVRESCILREDPEQAARVQAQQDALARLQARAAAGDEVVADLLTVLGLVL